MIKALYEMVRCLLSAIGVMAILIVMAVACVGCGVDEALLERMEDLCAPGSDVSWFVNNESVEGEHERYGQDIEEQLHACETWRP